VSLDLGDVETFLALAEELHFARTAERLHVSSARVTQRIQALEREVGGALFERTSRRVTLTPLGERLRDDLRGAYDGLVAAVGAARTAARKPAGPLRIGFTETTAGESLTALVRAIERGYPQIDVTLHQVPLTTPLDPLRANDIDVLVNWLVFDHPDLTQGPPLSEHALVLMVAADHPLARRASVTFEEAANYEFPALPELWRQVSRPMFFPLETPSGRPLRFHAEVDTWQETVSHVARGNAVHITVDVLADLLRRADLAYVPVVDLPPVALGPIWCTAHENARVRALVEMVQKSVPRVTGSHARNSSRQSSR
jgi:DNA-binding transcriptional LysR family regulator